MSLEKKATDKLKHVEASSIMSATATDKYEQPVVSYMASRGDGCTTEVKFCSPEAFAGFSNGFGHRHPHLRHGLCKAHRYDFTILIDTENGSEQVVGAHALPKQNFLVADMAGELPGRVFAPENAVINIRKETGEIDIHVFPSDFGRQMPGLVQQLESKTEISEGDRFEVFGVLFEVQQINGGEVIFDCRSLRSQPESIGRSGLGR